MDEEVRLLTPVGVLEVAVGLDALETDVGHQLPRVVLPERKHVEVVHRAVREAVPHAAQSLVDVLRLHDDVFTAVVVAVLARVPVVQHRVVIALIQDENSVVLEHRVELGQRLAPVAFREEMREGVAETDDGVVLPVDVTVEPSPVRLNDPQDVVSPLLAVLEGPRQHLRAAVRADGLESRGQERHGVESRARRHIEHALHPHFRSRSMKKLPSLSALFSQSMRESHFSTKLGTYSSV